MKKMIKPKELISLFALVLGSATMWAQPVQVDVWARESEGVCGPLQTDCSADPPVLCVDIMMRVDQDKTLEAYNIWVKYNGEVLSREAFNSNDTDPIGDNSCVMLNSNQDTDEEDPNNEIDGWRVGGVFGNFMMTANVDYPVHRICFIVVDATALQAGEDSVCVGGFYNGLATTAGFLDGTSDSDIPEACMDIDGNFSSCTLLNAPPVANRDDVTVNEDSMGNVIAVLGNDTDPDSDLGTPDITEGPSHGEAEVDDDDNTIIYTPDPNYVGYDTLIYEICDVDNPLVCDTALVVIFVAPVTDTINVTIDEDEDLVFCTNAEGMTIFSSGSGLSMVLCDDKDFPRVGEVDNGMPSTNCLTYTPDDNINGPDSICVVVCDPLNSLVCDTTIIAITITPAGDPPVAADDEYEMDEDGELMADASDGDDVGPDGPGTWMLVDGEGVEHGELDFNDDGSFTYTPDANFVGVDSFMYELCNANDPPECDMATVVITVNPVTDTINIETAEDTSFEFCTDEEGMTVFSTGHGTSMTTCGDSSFPDHGDVTGLPGACLTYMPDPNYSGPDSICLVVCDPANPMVCDTTILAITVMPVNDEPVAVNDTITTDEDTQIVNGSVAGNDTLSGDGGNMWSLVVDALHGTVTMDNDGSYTYTPDPNFNGVDVFTYMLCDVDNDCDQATVTITIHQVCEELNVKVILEGPYKTGPAQMDTLLNLYHLLPGQNPAVSTVPQAAANGVATAIGQPYTVAPWLWLGNEGHGYGDVSVNPGATPYPASVVDWVLVSVRLNPLSPTTKWKCAGLLRKNGVVEFPDACPCFDVEEGTATQYHVVVEHRNHLAVMSHATLSDLTKVEYDFTTANSWINPSSGSSQNVGQKPLGGIWAMYAANGNQVGASRTDITSDDNTVWRQQFTTLWQYLRGDFDLNADVNASDRAKFIQNNNLFNLIPH